MAAKNRTRARPPKKPMPPPECACPTRHSTGANTARRGGPPPPGSETATTARVKDSPFGMHSAAEVQSDWPSEFRGTRREIRSLADGRSSSAVEAVASSSAARPTPHHACMFAPRRCRSATRHTSYVRTHPLPSPAGNGGSVKERESSPFPYSSATLPAPSITDEASSPALGDSGLE
eukprot:scaffold1313_cov138-Isochrysis_galbana.AAC.7